MDLIKQNKPLTRVCSSSLETSSFKFVFNIKTPETLCGEGDERKILDMRTSSALVPRQTGMEVSGDGFIICAFQHEEG